MTRSTHNPAVLALANGTALANGASTGGAAGAVLVAVTSSGGAITYQDGTWQSVGNPGAARLDHTPPSTPTILLVEALFDLVATPTGANNRLIEVMTSAGFACRVDWQTDGRIRLYNAANTSIHTSTNPIAAGTRCRVMLGVGLSTGSGTGNADGDLILGYYTAESGTSDTPVQTVFSSATALASTGTISTVRLNRITSTAASTATVRLVNMQSETGDLTPIGALDFSSPPTAVVTQPVDGIVDARDSVAGDGGTLAFDIEWTSGANEESGITELDPGLWHVPADTDASGTYTVTVTETPSGLDDSDTAIIAPVPTGAVNSLIIEVWDADLEEWV